MSKDSVNRQKQTGSKGQFGHLVKGEPSDTSLTADTPTRTYGGTQTWEDDEGRPHRTTGPAFIGSGTNDTERVYRYYVHGVEVAEHVGVRFPVVKNEHQWQQFPDEVRFRNIPFTTDDGLIILDRAYETTEESFWSGAHIAHRPGEWEGTFQNMIVHGLGKELESGPLRITLKSGDHYVSSTLR